MVVSTPALEENFRAYCPHIFVIGNRISEQLWWRPKLTVAGRIVIGFAGTESHRHDLELVREPLLRLGREVGDRLLFRFLGYAPPWARKLPRVEVMAGAAEYGHYAQILPMAGFDIALAPLVDGPFNRCKSAIKWLEYSAAGSAGIYSPVGEYAAAIEDGKTGLLVDGDADDWYHALVRLIEDTDLRQTLARHAAQTVWSRYEMKMAREPYLAMLRECTERRD